MLCWAASAPCHCKMWLILAKLTLGGVAVDNRRATTTFFLDHFQARSNPLLAITAAVRQKHTTEQEMVYFRGFRHGHATKLRWLFQREEVGISSFLLIQIKLQENMSYRGSPSVLPGVFCSGTPCLAAQRYGGSCLPPLQNCATGSRAERIHAAQGN